MAQLSFPELGTLKAVAGGHKLLSTGNKRQGASMTAEIRLAARHTCTI